MATTILDPMGPQTRALRPWSLSSGFSYAVPCRVRYGCLCSGYSYATQKRTTYEPYGMGSSFQDPQMIPTIHAQHVCRTPYRIAANSQ